MTYILICGKDAIDKTLVTRPEARAASATSCNTIQW